jgi:hypothetical protein
MSQKLKKIICAVLIGVSTYLIAGYFLERQFSIQSVTIPGLPAQEQPTPNGDALFDKPFTYLDRGHQSYVFLSDNKEYVLKFFDARSIKRYGYIPFLTLDDSARTERRLNDLLNGYRIAWEKDRENCGLLYVQFAPNPIMKATATLQDRFGFVHRIDLSTVPFVVQKAAVTTRATLNQLLGSDDVATAKERLGAIVDMYFDEYAKGVYDRDRNYIDNTGFIGSQPMRMDAGRLRFDPEMKKSTVHSKDIYNVLVKRTDRFLGKYFPAYREEIVGFLEKKILSQIK